MNVFFYLGVQKSVLMGIMTMLVCNMDPNAFAQTPARKEAVKKRNALMVVPGTTVSKCVEDLGTSISSTLMHTKQQLMIGAVETHCKTNITKNGMLTWIIVVLEVSLWL